MLALITTVYVAGLFVAAWLGDYHSRLFKRFQSVIYSLSLTIYCTSWTFFGAIGQASEALWSFIPIYLGPIIIFVLFWKLLQKLITVSKQENITSIADFIASRHGRSTFMAVLVTVILVIGVMPYIALQLKAIVMGFTRLTHAGAVSWSNQDLALAVTLTLAVFVIIFGTRKLDATEHQNGIITAIAFESLIKLFLFLLVGGWVIVQSADRVDWLVDLPDSDAFADHGSVGLTMLMPTIMAMAAVLCLPRQFHVTVVENNHMDHFYRARWLFPIYLLLLALLVAPLALIGRQLLGADVPGDTYLIELPKRLGSVPMALLAFLGGVSAAISMVIVATLALTTMVSNEILMPLLLRRYKTRESDNFYRFSGLLLNVRRVTIVCLLMMSWVVYRLLEATSSLASIGQMSFSAVAQLAPVLIGSLYLRESNAKAGAGGLLAGFLVWCFCLVLPMLVKGQWLGAEVMSQGLFGYSWLRPGNLFGLSMTETVAGVTLLALTLNILVYLLGCLYLRPGAEEKKQAGRFVDVLQHDELPDVTITVAELEALAGRFVSKQRVQALLTGVGANGALRKTLDRQKLASPELVMAVERLLAGTLGASSARIVMKSLVRGKVALEEVQALVEEASEVFQFNRELLQGAIEHISLGVSVIDRDLKLVAWNQQYLQLFAYPKDLITVGRPIAEVIRHNANCGLCGEGEVEQHVRKRLEYMQRGTAHRSERRREDGRVIRIQGNPMPGGGFVMTFTDITEFRQVEQALQEVNESLELRVAERTHELSLLNRQLLKAKSQAERANHLRSRFFAAISHDLMQPMNAARLFSAALELEAKDSGQQELAHNISTSLKSAEHLITDVLDMTRLEAGQEAGKMVVNSREFPIMEVLKPLESEFSLLAHNRPLRFRVKTSNVWVRTDPMLLRRVLQNFLTNAFRYVEPVGGAEGGEMQAKAQPKVLLGCRYLHNEQLMIEVRDNGAGIPKAQQALIFSEFKRLSTVPNGLGLGLSIAKGIAHILDARLTLKSSPGNGSVFAITVPVVQRKEVCQVPVAPGKLQMQILCVDDDAEITRAMASLLSRWGCQVHTANSPQCAFKILEQQQPDVLMVDYQLGEITGIELIERIRRLAGCSLNAVLVTANQQDDVRKRCAKKGIGFLKKPVKPAAMRAILNRYGARNIVREQA